MAEDLSCLPCTLDDKEQGKFTCNSEGKIAIRTVGETIVTLPDLNSGTILIYNLSLPVASTEVSQLLTDKTKQLVIRVRERAKLQLSFVSGESGTKYITLPKGTVLTLDDLDLVTSSIYMQSPVAGVTVEILETT